MAGTPAEPPVPEVPEVEVRPVTGNAIDELIKLHDRQAQHRKDQADRAALSAIYRAHYKLETGQDFPADPSKATLPEAREMARVIEAYDASLKPPTPEPDPGLAVDLGLVPATPADDPSAAPAAPDIPAGDPGGGPSWFDSDLSGGAGAPADDGRTPPLDDTLVRPAVTDFSAPEFEEVVRVVGGLVRASGRKVFKGIRPEDIEPDDFPSAPDSHTLLKAARESW
jgi:hypothetical protein